MLLNVALEKEIEQYSRGSGINPFAYRIFKQGAVYRLGDVCYSNARYRDKLSAFVISLSPFKGKAHSGNHKKFLKYIIERSPWKAAYNGRSMGWALRFGISMNLKVSHSYMLAAAVAVRETWEFPKLADTWAFLVKKGINEDFAYLICRGLSFSHNSFYADMSQGHHCIGEIPKDYRKEAFSSFRNLRDNPPKLKGRNAYRFFSLTSTYCPYEGAGKTSVWLLPSPKTRKGTFGYEVNYFPVKETIQLLKFYEEEFLSCE